MIYHYRTSAFNAVKPQLINYDLYLQTNYELTARLYIECVNVLSNGVLDSLGLVAPLLAPQLLETLDKFPDNEARAGWMQLAKHLPDLTSLDNLNEMNYRDFFKRWTQYAINPFYGSVTDLNNMLALTAPSLIEGDVILSEAIQRKAYRQNGFGRAIHSYLAQHNSME